MQRIKDREEQIRTAIRNGDIVTVTAVNKVLERFLDEDILLGGKKGEIFQKIYCGKEEDNWKISIKGYVGERTLFRYRNIFLIWIDFYKNKMIKEAA